MILTVPAADLELSGKFMKLPYTAVDGRAKEVLLMHLGTKILAYHNRCRHWPVPLDQDHKDIIDLKGERLTCSVHGAQYNLKSGECFAGACRGASLKACNVELRGDQIVIDTGD